MLSSFIGSLNKYVDFSGRATRKEFWSFVFFYYLTYFLASVVDAVMGIDVISGLVAVGTTLPYISCAARRMHDVGKSGWFMIVPFYNLILALSPSVPEKTV